MIPKTRQVLHDRRHVAMRADAQDPSALELAALGNVESAIVIGDTGPWTVLAAGRDGRLTAIRFDAQQARRRPYFAIGVSRFDDVEAAAVIEGDAGGEGQPLDHGLDRVPVGKRDVARLEGSRLARIRLSTAGRAA
jgi:hypothetical protein